MGFARSQREVIRTFILQEVEKHPADIIKMTAARFGCSRQAACRHVNDLVKTGVLHSAGRTKGKQFELAWLLDWSMAQALPGGPAEDLVWYNQIQPHLEALPEANRECWQYGFTEIYNNVLDHADAGRVTVRLRQTAVVTELIIADDGVGIFKKIQSVLGLADARHAVLELSKGKFTSAPDRHSGQGIFFCSRVFDYFAIDSGGLRLERSGPTPAVWQAQDAAFAGPGTTVTLRLGNGSCRNLKAVFDEYSGGDDYGFIRTVVPVRLAQYGNANLVSRSQARRLLAGVDRFSIVELDFTGVQAVGQAFADEVFRVFARQHPELQIFPINANAATTAMITRATAAEVSTKTPSVNSITPLESVPTTHSGTGTLGDTFYFS